MFKETEIFTFVRKNYYFIMQISVAQKENMRAKSRVDLTASRLHTRSRIDDAARATAL